MNLPCEPLCFAPHFIETIWGGRKLHDFFNKDTNPQTTTGESWELSGITDHQTLVSEGSLKHRSIADLISHYGKDIIGKRFAEFTSFPLLLKFIDAQTPLSVQVHPNDHYAKVRFNEPFGKTECWFIAHAGPKASICVGFKKDLTHEKLRKAITTGTLEPLLNIFPVVKGELYFIPAGTVHAIMGDVVIYEIQQSSNNTLRMYDWNRTDASGNPRTLHIEDAVAVAELSSSNNAKISPTVLHDSALYTSLMRVNCPYFALEEFQWKKAATAPLTAHHSFRIVTMLEGAGELQWKNGQRAIQKGSTVLIPASLSECALSSSKNASCLLTYLPAIEKDVN